MNATKKKHGIAGKGCAVIGADGSYELRESPAPYKTILGRENDDVRLQNVSFCNETPVSADYLGPIQFGPGSGGSERL